eukprot:3811570-Pyramimonas_sp.AAC.1
MCIFEVSQCPVQQRPLTRLRHAALFEEAAIAFVNEHGQQQIEQACDSMIPKPRLDIDTSTKWKVWHARAEHALEEAAVRGW